MEDGMSLLLDFRTGGLLNVRNATPSCPMNPFIQQSEHPAFCNGNSEKFQ